MNTRSQTKDGTDQYPERDKVSDEDESSREENVPGKPAGPGPTNERQKEERRNRGPERQPGFGQGA